MKSSTAPFRKNGAGSTQQLREFSENLGSVNAIAILFPLSQLILIPGIFGVVHLIYERGAGLAHAGGFLPLLGTAGVVLLSVSLGYLGLRILRMPEGEWILES